ncbi:NAD(P)H-dependent flavin oxidoreductase [Salicibibacter kimchii]|uniref:Probable nitronate monooxygenase n=1 Tax=Salicibibacter kimchii TaxID=2099786 RepID=A0A345BW40_9BACI|nr:nitronate monooxygenase [Salicibibacter kimchii]AXF55171.1 nitronate monooxygenase [Salicibibacter kimchii]
MKTSITDLLNIEYPIICGGMFRLGLAPLMAAVSKAGGMGFITSGNFETSDRLRQEIRLARQITDKPIGVNITISPRRLELPNEEFIDVLIEEGVRVVETAGKSPEKYMKVLKDNGVTVVHKAPSVRYAKKAEQIGVDAVTIIGIEAGGHPGEGDIGGLSLIPQTVDAVKIPVIAGGGIADGRGLAAALSLGAEGILMGTRFMATQESILHENIKQWMIDASEIDSSLIQRSIGSTHRVSKNNVAMKVLEAENRGASLKEILPLIEGEKVNRVFFKGEIDAGVWSCGTSVGLIQDILTVQETINSIVKESHQILNRVNELYCVE